MLLELTVSYLLCLNDGPLSVFPQFDKRLVLFQTLSDQVVPNFLHLCKLYICVLVFIETG